MKSMGGVFSEHREELIQALVNPANRDLPANAITGKLYVDHLDLSPSINAPTSSKPAISTPEHQFAPMLSTISLPGQIPVTTAELADFAASNPTPGDTMVVLQAAMEGPLGESIQNMTRVLQETMPLNGSKAEQMAQSQTLEQLLHKANEQVAQGADPIAARVEIQDWNGKLKDKFQNASDIRLAWAITRLANIMISAID